MSEKLTYNVTFKEKNSFNLFQQTTAAATIQPLYLMPHGRVKVYELTEGEVNILKNDPHVQAVEPTKDRHWAKPEIDWTQTGRWSRGAQSFSASGPGQNMDPTNKNWALWRCYSGENQPINDSGQYWGYSEARRATNRSEFPTLTTGTLDISATGKNVDIVIVDSGHVPSKMFELQKNADGSGGSRVIEYNWNQHWAEIIGSPGATKPPIDYSSTTWGEHGTLVASHAAGNTQGWARDANIYTFSLEHDWDDLIPSPMAYIAAFHRNKPINPETGRKNPTVINNSWSYRFGGFSIWDHVTELWDQEGTRLLQKSDSYSQMLNFAPCVAGPGTQDPYVPSSTVYLDPIKPLKNKFFDAQGEITTFAKYQITTTSDLSGAQILTVPTGWQQSPFSPKPYYRDINRSSTIAEITAGKSFVVQAPCQVNLYVTLSVRNTNLTGTLKTEIKVYRGSTLIKTAIGTMGLFSYTNMSEEFTDNSQYTITYKAIELNASADSTIVESGSFTATNHDYTCVKTNDFHGDAENIPGDNTYDLKLLPDDFNWEFFGYKVGKNIGTLAAAVDAHGIKFSVPTGEWAGVTYTPRILLGRTTWEDSPNDPWISSPYQLDEISGTVGSRVYTMKRRTGISSDYSVQDWTGDKYIQVIYKIYENIPNYLEIEVGKNTAYVKQPGSYSWTAFKSVGWISNQLSAEVQSVLADYEDGIDQGVITCGSAGNNKNLISTPGHGIHNNKLRLVYPPKSVDAYEPIAPAVTPGCAGGIDKSIAVGAIENSSYERIAYFSSRGPGTAIFAPGMAMIGADYAPGYNNIADPRSTSSNIQYLTVGNGTSFSAPTVCGMMALIAEKFPYFTQKEMRDYLMNSAGKDQIIDPVYDGDNWGQWQLRDSPNNYLRYREERQKTGTVSPAVKRNVRPSSGVLFPRRRGGKK